MSKFFSKVLSRKLYIYLFLFVVTLVAYAPALRGPFFFDDNIFIEHNVSVQNFDLKQIYTSSTTAGSGLSGDNFYRPNGQAIFALLTWLFGLSPLIFHFVNIALHATLGFLIFLFFSDLGLQRLYAILGSLLFLLHPIQTEAVSYISGISDPLLGLVLIGTLILFARGLEGGEGFSLKYWVSILLLTLVGFFTKENFVILPALMLVTLIYIYMKGRAVNWKRGILVLITVSILTALYLWARFTIFNFTSDITGGFAIPTFANVYTESLSIRLITFISIFYHYVWMLLVPIGLHYETPYVAYDTLSTFSGVFGFTLIFGGAYLALLSLSRRKGIFFFTYSWFFVALLPFSGIIPTNAMYLEHWLYVPIIGVVFFVVYALQISGEEFGASKSLFLYVPVIVLCIYLSLTIYRNTDWADPIRFYQNELEYGGSARIYANLGLELANRGNCEQAIPYYRQAILISDQYPQTHHNLGRCLEDSGNTTEATAEYKRALEIDPNFSYSIERLRLLEDGKEYGLAEVAEMVGGIGAERVRQIESKALRKLRQHNITRLIINSGLEDYLRPE